MAALNRSTPEIRREDILSPVVQRLIDALNAELDARYPEEGANHFRLDPEEVADGRGAFLVAYIGGKPVGCGALRRIEPAVAEIKRMYVAPEAHGRGVGRQVLLELEAEAQRSERHGSFWKPVHGNPKRWHSTVAPDF